MKHFMDGDEICVVRDDFVDLQESAAVFLSPHSLIGQAVLEMGIDQLPPLYVQTLEEKLLAEERSMEYQALLNDGVSSEEAARTVDASFMPFEEWQEHHGRS